MRLTVALTTAWLVLLAVLGWYEFGSVSSALVYLRGGRLIPDQYSKSFGSVSSRSEQRVTFKIANYTRNPHKILGMRSSCTCLEAEETLPQTIPAGGELNLAIGVRKRLKGTTVDEFFSLYTDYGDQPELVLHVSGEFRDGSEQAPRR